ncbi:MAG TPA: hypothetical protein VIY29_03160 [Ktedonobacteraceae bacterium]
MSLTTLYRLSGTALLLGSLIAACGVLLKLGSGLDISNPLWVPGFLLVLVGSTLLVLGLPGMFVQQISKAGILGVVGFVIFSCALLILGISSPAINAFILPAFARVSSQEPAALAAFFITGDLLQFVGTLVLGIALMRARVVPTWVGILVILSGVVLLGGRALQAPKFVYIGLSPLLLYIALCWSGYMLWSRQGARGVLTQTTTSASHIPN